MSTYRGLVALFAYTTVLLGITLVIVTVVRGGGSSGIVIGVLFVAAGAGRLWMARRRR